MRNILFQCSICMNIFACLSHTVYIVHYLMYALLLIFLAASSCVALCINLVWCLLFLIEFAHFFASLGSSPL